MQHAPELALDSAGNLVLTGELNGMVDFGGGPLANADGVDLSYDIAVAKLSP